jgi:hypothetical protein
MEATAGTTRTHNPSDETHWASGLRENLTSRSYGEGLETGRATTQAPRQSLTRQVWHRILKSGCRIEARQLGTAERLPRCLTLYSVMAWRVFYATMLARAVPEMPCSVLLEIAEWQALYCAIHHCPTPPPEPPTLAQAVCWIARLGGFVGRRRSDQPGTEILWRGFQHLSDLTRMYCIM